MSARSLNKVTLIGNLTRDPELRYTPQGTAVCTFGLATNRSWTPADGGERQEETEFHRIVAWSKLAEICSQILYKGRKAYVEGRLQTRDWTSQDGQERQTTEIVIDSMIALGAPRSGSRGEVVPEEPVGMGESASGSGSQADSGAGKPSKKSVKKKRGATKGKKVKEKKKKVEKKEEKVEAKDIPF
jgi:single-strand DNA-binding protein